MSEFKWRCFGCGCELQNTDPFTTGYTPKIIDGSTILCQRCYRLQHYGDFRDEALVKPDYKKIFENVIRKKCLIIYVVDLFFLESSLIRDLASYISGSPILVVANKRDILPKNVNDEKLKQFVQRKFKQEGIEIKGVICSSAYKKYNIDEIISESDRLRNGKDIYIVGASSVGKSSLINALLKTIKNETRDLISTSPYPGTTVATITIPLDNKSRIYDTPGIVPPDSMFLCMEKAVLKHIIPKSEIKPITYQLNARQTILLGGIARFDFLEGPRSGFTFYLSNNVELHRCKAERADMVMDSLIGQAKIRPVSASIASSASLVPHELVLPNERVDVVILGLGWINVQGKGQKVRIWTPEGVSIVVRDPKI